MCKDGKCHGRSAVVSLGRAARDVAVLAGRPQSVAQLREHVAIFNTIPEWEGPGWDRRAIISVDASTSDEEIERKADQFVIDQAIARARPPSRS